MIERSEIFPAKSAQTREYRIITGIDPRRSPTAFNACDWATRLTACPPLVSATRSPRRRATRQSKIASQHGGSHHHPGSNMCALRGLSQQHLKLLRDEIGQNTPGVSGVFRESSQDTSESKQR